VAIHSSEVSIVKSPAEENNNKVLQK